MAYRLKTTGIAASCTMCIAVDPDTNTIKDFASATVTAGITVDAGITIGQQDWDGNTRKYIQLAANNFVNFTAGSQPSFVLGAAPSNRTIVWIGEAAGPGARVFGTSSSDYFYSQDTTTGLDHPTLYMGGTKFTGGMANIAAGEKRIFGFSLTRGAVSTAYTALHNAASMTSAATSSVGVGANWTLATIGRRTANTTQQNDKVHAILIFNVALTQAEWDTLRDDWFGVLLEVDPTSGPIFNGTLTLDDSAVSGSFATGASAFSGAVALDASTVTGSFTVQPGTITSQPLKTNNGTLLASAALTYVAVYDAATGALVTRQTGLSTGGDGRFSVSSASIVPGTQYRVDWETAAGERRMPLAVAA